MVGIVVQVGVVALVAGIGMAMVRVVRGPEVAARVLAVDQQRSLSLDVALLVAVVGFASTLAFAQFIGATRSGTEPPDDQVSS